MRYTNFFGTGNDYSSMFLISIVVSCITSVFSQSVSQFIRYMINYCFSWLWCSCIVYQNANPKLYKDFTKFVTDMEQPRCSEYLSTNNGNICFPKKLAIYGNFWVWMSFKTDSKAFVEEKSILYLYFFTRFRVKNRFERLKKLVFEKYRQDSHEYETIQIYKFKTYGWDKWLLCKEIFTKLPQIYFPNKLIHRLEYSVQDFLNNEIRYAKLGLNYNKKFLFLGPPGTGKTSMIRYLAIKFRLSLYCMDFEHINNSRTETIVVRQKGLLILEDFDRYLASLQTKVKPNPDISKILNFLEGFNSLDNVIIIITANSIDNIPEAIFRPGRIDEKIEFPLLTKDVFEKIQTDYPQLEGNFKEEHKGLSPAQLLVPLRNNYGQFGKIKKM